MLRYPPLAAMLRYPPLACRFELHQHCPKNADSRGVPPLQTCKAECYSFETGEKGPALNVLMAAIDPANAAAYNANAKAFFRIYLEQIIPYTPGGLAFPYHWGAFRPTTQVTCSCSCSTCHSNQEPLPCDAPLSDLEGSYQALERSSTFFTRKHRIR